VWMEMMDWGGKAQSSPCPCACLCARADSGGQLRHQGGRHAHHPPQPRGTGVAADTHLLPGALEARVQRPSHPGRLASQPKLGRPGLSSGIHIAATTDLSLRSEFFRETGCAGFHTRHALQQSESTTRPRSICTTRVGSVELHQASVIDYHQSLTFEPRSAVPKLRTPLRPSV
jgi:hypothetical protein